jgi:Uma2 family endonuclease
MIANLQPQKMTVEEYLAWESRQELRHEYCNGEVFAMAGGTKNHDERTMSGSDVKVLVRKGLSYRYPDLSISCDARDEAHDTFYEFPTLIAEVLSPGTESVDRIDKFKEYIQLPTLQHYLLISADQIRVECYRRGEGRMWLYFQYETGDIITLDSIGVELPIEQIYKGIELELCSTDS